MLQPNFVAAAVKTPVVRTQPLQVKTNPTRPSSSAARKGKYHDADQSARALFLPSASPGPRLHEILIRKRHRLIPLCDPLPQDPSDWHIPPSSPNGAT